MQGDENVRETLRFIARRNLPPIIDQLHLVDSETEIVPDILAVEALGHTPGHMALSVSSEGEYLLCIADAVMHPLHVEQPSWHSISVFPKQVEKTRHKLFRRAMEEKALVLAFHFQFPGLGHIIQMEDLYHW